MTRPRPHLWIWFLWLAAFYAAWALIVFGHAGWQTVADHWPMALAMALGSYVAGSTPMGGGTVGFPVLVLLFELPASLGRDFSFAVQSIGMTSASIFILARRQPLAWAMLKGSLWGALVGAPLGILFIAPLVPELWIKLSFAVIWASFGVLHLYRVGEFSAYSGMTSPGERWDFRVGCVVGLGAGATVASVTGVGIDMMLYAALVLLCRADLKIAIPTSVIVMAFTSVLGIAVKSVTTGLQPGVFENWLAAAPVVALGAPLGAFAVALIGRKPTLLFVAVLCVGQFVWTCWAERAALGATGMALAVAAVVLALLGLERLRSWGRALGGCRTWGADGENRPQRADFLPGSLPHRPAMGQEDGEKAAAAADLQPATPKSDSLLWHAPPDAVPGFVSAQDRPVPQPHR